MDKYKIRKAWIDFLVEGEYTHAVTLKPNGKRANKSDGFLANLFVRFHMLIQRRLLGRWFHKPLNRMKQTPAAAFFEGNADTGHIHAAFKIAPEHWDTFEGMFTDEQRADTNIWKKLVPDGTCVAERIYDPQRWYDYISKEMWQADGADRTMLLPLSV